jgi:hypothetical protein
MKNKETSNPPNSKASCSLQMASAATTQSKAIKYLIHIWEVAAAALQPMKWDYDFTAFELRY